jgi:hypothetical protein
MGHLVNPISFRLGISRCWNSCWTNDGKNLIFSCYSKFDWNMYSFFNRFFESDLIQKSGFIFSHVKILRNLNEISCFVYFHDGSYLEKFDSLKQIFLSNSCQQFFLPNIFFFTLFAYLHFLKWKYYSSKFFKSLCFNYVFRFYQYKKFYLYFRVKFKFYQYYNLFNFFFNNSKLKFLIFFLNFMKLSLLQGNNSDKFWFSIFLSFYYKILFFFKKQLYSKYFLYNLFFSNILIFFKILYKINQNFVNLNYTLRKFFFIKNIFLFYKTLYRVNKFYLYFSNLNSKNFYKNFLNLKLLLINSRLLSIRFLKRSLKKFLFGRFFVYFFPSFVYFFTKFSFSVTFLFNYYLKHCIKYFSFFNIKVFWKLLSPLELNAKIISKYICIRLKQRFQLRETLIPILKHLSNHSFLVNGFRITCAGRFTRNEIATYDLRTYSSVPFSNTSATLDYSFSDVVLKYSICGVKVWLHKNVFSEYKLMSNLLRIGKEFIYILPFIKKFLFHLKKSRNAFFRFKRKFKLNHTNLDNFFFSYSVKKLLLKYITHKNSFITKEKLKKKLFSKIRSHRYRFVANYDFKLHKYKLYNDKHFKKFILTRLIRVDKKR